MEGLSQKEQGLMDMDNSVVIVGERAWVEVKEDIRAINSNKKTIKIDY